MLGLLGSALFMEQLTLPLNHASLRRLEQTLSELLSDLQDDRIDKAMSFGKEILDEWSQKYRDGSQDNVLFETGWKDRWRSAEYVDWKLFEDPGMWTKHSDEVTSVFMPSPIILGRVTKKWRLLKQVFQRIIDFALDEDEDIAPPLRSALRAYFSYPGSMVKPTIRRVMSAWAQFPRMQRRLLEVLDGNGNVPIGKVLRALYGSADDGRWPILDRLKSRTNKKLTSLGYHVEIAKQKDTLTLRAL